MARRQLAGLDISAPRIRSWLRSGFLIRRLPGVYAVGHTAPSVTADLTAALLYAGPDAALSHDTAAWWLGLLDRRPATIHVSTPRRCTSLPGIKVHDRRKLTRSWHRDLPVVPVVQVLLDIAATVPDRLARALAQAEYHDYVDLALLAPDLGQGRPGTRSLRDALAHHNPSLARTRSELETAFLGLCAAHDIPAPEVNVTVEGHLVDMLWREQRVVVELDGAANHRQWGQIQRDRARDLALRAAGYLVLRYVWTQVIGAPTAVAQDVRSALSGRPDLD